MISLDVNLMDAVLDESIQDHGFEATLTNLILPILQKMEVLWLSGSIEAAHEACFHELIRRKTTREIDLMPHNCSGPKLMMFLPQGNQQELSHLFMHFFLRKEGLCVTDMGSGISMDCACSALKKCCFDSVLIVNADPVHWQFGSYVKELANRTNIPIIISGRASDNDWAVGDDKIIVIDAIDETVRFVSHLHENLKKYIS